MLKQNIQDNTFKQFHQLTKRLFTAKELAEYIGWPIATIYSQKCRGIFPKQSIVRFAHSRKLFFDKQIIDEWIDEQHLYR
ncbi:MAG: hypothetical protein IJ876_05605 [Elusimicrobiaceae bacterium]|nr:hypothetical protein [Elusimicrobiaceae bacterium]